MARVFVTRRLPGPALDRLAAVHDVEIWTDRAPPEYETLKAEVAHAQGLLALLTDRVDAELIESAPELKAISNYAVGVDNVDLAAATRRGIPVGHTPDVLTGATADLAFALLLAAARKLTEAAAAVKQGDWITWEAARHMGREVDGQTLGIVGLGRIGRAVAQRASGFEMEVVHTGGTREGAVSLEDLLERSDFVSLHCPLTPETHQLIDAAALKRMKPTAILVNTARGPIVDQVALKQALEDGQIAGAALDVTDPEPLPADDPLLSAPNLIVTPHIGSATQAARERMADLAVDNLLAGWPAAPCLTRPTGSRRPRETSNRPGRPIPPPMPRVAVVDIGSNTTRLYVAEINDGRVTLELDRRTKVTRLGQGVDQDRRLQPESMQRVFDTLDDYALAIEEHGADHRLAVLTSAVRDAANGREFADQVNERYGLTPHILTGDQEAQLTFLGATSERDPNDATPTLLIDIGGGSTELVIGEGRKAGFHVSTQAGVVRQTERHLHADPPERHEMAELSDDVRQILSAAVPIEQRTAVTQAIAVAGTATSLAAIAQRLEPYDPARVHGYHLTRAEAERILARLAAVVLEERKKTPGLDPARAPTIVAGVLILEQVLDLFGLEEIEVSEHDILRGAALGLTPNA